MSSTHQYIRAAAERIDDGWAQRAFVDQNGGVCLVQGLMIGTGQRRLNEEVVTSVHRELRRNPAYLVIRALDFLAVFFGKKYRRASRTASFMVWNDLPGRRKKSVVLLLHVVADKLELSWLRSHNALQRQAIAEQQADAVRHANRRADKLELKLLEGELSRQWMSLSSAESACELVSA